MKLDVTLCHSILKQFFVVNSITGSNSDLNLVNEIRKNRIVLNDDLITCYEIEFEKDENNNLLDIFQQWIANETVKPIGETLICVNDIHSTLFDTFVTDNYLQILVNVAYTTYDKIIFSDLLTPYQLQLESLGLYPMSKNKILDRTDINFYYNAYHLPYNKEIQSNELNSDLSAWFKRILKDENNIHILDSYLLQNISKFKQYILPHIKHNANLYFYSEFTKDNSLGRNLNNFDFINEFSGNPNYSNWVVTNVFKVVKAEIHDRGILTDNYFIKIGKGLDVFGNDTHTNRCYIDVFHKSNWNGNLPLPQNIII